MAGSNGKHPAALNIDPFAAIEQAHLKLQTPWRWEALGLDFVIRPVSVAESAEIDDQMGRLQRDAEQYRDTPDQPPSIAAIRIQVGACLSCLLDPVTREPFFTEEHLDALLTLPTPTLKEMIDEVGRAANFTRPQATEAAKNSEEIEGNKPSSISPSEVETLA